MITPDDEVFIEVLAERRRQDTRWGEQNHPDGTGGPAYEAMARQAKWDVDQVAMAGAATWALILEEEVFEALEETDEVKLYDELIQVAAVAMAWASAIRRRV